MKLNVDTCKIYSIKGRDGNKFSYSLNKSNNSFALERVDHIKDFGVIIDEGLYLDLHRGGKRLVFLFFVFFVF